MSETLEGVILERDGAYAKVRPQRHTECDDCQACFAADLIVLTYNPVGATVGQTVRYVQAQHGMLLIAWVLFFQPLLAVFLGLGLGAAVASALGVPPVGLMVVGAGVCLGLAVTFVLWFDRRFKLNRTNFARIIEIVR